MSARSLSVGFDVAAPLLSNIEFDLDAGERVAMVGPSGCGKTTLLRTLAGLIDPLCGTIRCGGESQGARGWPRYRRRVMFVQHRPAMIHGTVEANLRRPFDYHISNNPFPERRAAEWLRRLRLSDTVVGQDARRLSAGEGLRVGLVRALLCEPKILLLDEPTGALDEAARVAVETLLREESERMNTAMLVVTHQSTEAEAWCHRTLDLAPHVGSTRRKGSA